MIPRSFVNDILARADIVEIIGQRVALKKSGQRHKGLCPFHEEKTPSFSVDANRQFYYCFGCGAHGTALGFLMDYERLSFPEAVEELAGSLGLEVPRERSAAHRPQADPGIYDVLAAADRRYRAWLRGSEAAIGYLKGRGISGAAARDFGIGLAPPGWDGIKSALAEYGQDKLLAAGLVAQSDSGRIYDRFRNRIMFPIRDTRGRVIGFGGRIFNRPAEGEPKYLNSPETDVFRKGREIYGLFEARRNARRLDSVTVVEGYMDVVALAQHGVANAVATLGTAIGGPHFQVLYRYVEQVACCFDGDDAGRAAAWRAVEAALPALSSGRQLRFAFLPDGEDPDTLVRSAGAQRFGALLRDALPVGEYLLAQLEKGLDLKRVDHRAMLGELAIGHLRRLPEGALRSALARQIALRAQMDPRDIERHLHGGAAAPAPRTAMPAQAPRPRSKLAERMLHLLVKRPASLAELPRGDLVGLVDATADAHLLGDVVRYLAEEPDADAAMLLGRFVGDAAHGELTQFAIRPALLPEAALGSEFGNCVERYLAQRQGVHRRMMARSVADGEDLKRYWELRRARQDTA